MSTEFRAYITHTTLPVETDREQIVDHYSFDNPRESTSWYHHAAPAHEVTVRVGYHWHLGRDGQSVERESWLWGRQPEPDYYEHLGDAIAAGVVQIVSVGAALPPCVCELCAHRCHAP